MHSLILRGSPRNFWQLWPLHLRAAMLFLLDPRPGPIYPSLVCFFPSTVYFLLSSAGEVTSLRVTLPGRWMDALPFCQPSLLGLLSILLSRCIYLGLELSTLTMGSLIRLLIVFIFSGWYVVSSAVKVLLRLADFLLPMIWCWLFGSL